MSAPETNVAKQEKNHRTPLIGMAAMVIFALVLLVGLVIWLSAAGNEPEELGAQTEVVPGAVTSE